MYKGVEEFERKYVHDVYDWEASERKRSLKRWNKVEQFISSFTEGSIIADLGCGEGKYITSTSQQFMVGVERCKEMSNHFNNKEITIADLLNLPYRSCVFDGVICVAVVHHLVTKRRRRLALSEIARVLRSGGTAFITVFAIDSIYSQFSGRDVLMPMKKDKISANRSLHHNEAVNEHPVNNSNNNSNWNMIKYFQNTKMERLLLFITKELNNFKVKKTLPTNKHNMMIDKAAPKGNLRHYHSCFELSSIGCDKKSTQLDEESEASSIERKSKPEILKYYHIFTDLEFYELLKEVRTLKFIDRYFDNRNWVYIVEKL